jgi:hypothetical protein
LPALDASLLTNIPGATKNASDPATDTNPSGGVGTEWHNTTSGEVYICTDATAGANVWTNVGAGTGDIDPYTHAMGKTYSYQSGGTSSNNVITKFSFASHGTPTDVGDLSVGRHSLAGSSSSTHGYSQGGYNSKVTIDKFSFSADGNAVDHGDLFTAHWVGAGASSVTHGYAVGGVSTGDTIQKYAFSANVTGTDVGNLTVGARRLAGVACSATYGHALGGNNPNDTDNVDKFSFSSDGNSTDFATLSGAGRKPTATNSKDYGYACGGLYSVNTIEKFAFASGGAVTDVGDLVVARADGPAGTSSTTHGYIAGGYSTAIYYGIDQHSFASDGNGTNVGTMAAGRQSQEMAGQQV